MRRDVFAYANGAFLAMHSRRQCRRHAAVSHRHCLYVVLPNAFYPYAALTSLQRYAKHRIADDAPSIRQRPRFLSVCGLTSFQRLSFLQLSQRIA